MKAAKDKAKTAAYATADSMRRAARTVAATAKELVARIDQTVVRTGNKVKDAEKELENHSG